MKKEIMTLSILSMIAISSFVNAWELSLQPADGKYSSWCTLWIDIVMDPQWKEISATDIIIESSMQFVKFEPTQLFPYFLPPKTTDNITHIVWFTALWKSQRINQKWIIWKIFLKPKNKSDRDWSIKFYFKKKWDTTDTNLSIWWWVDILQNTQNWFYTFDGANCDYPEDLTTQEQWNINFEDELNQTMKQIEKDHRSEQLQKFRNNNKYYIISIFITLIALLTYFKIFKWKSKKK